MSFIVPIPMWSQRSRNITSYRPCAGEWSEDWSPLHRPGKSETIDGEIFERDETPHHGDHVNALPYWSRKTTASVPSWEASNVSKWGPCDAYEQKGDGRVFTGIAESELLLSNKIVKDDRDFCQRFALMKAQGALRAADASIPMMLKERAATVAMMKSYAGRGLDLIRRRQLADVKRWKSFKNRPREQKKFLAQTIANEHLMFIFGLLPLLEELEGLAKHVTRDEHKFIKGRGRHTKKIEEVSSRQESGYPFYTVTKKQSVYSVRCDLRADINMQILARAQKLGFNPLYTLYDFTPLSFVTGWFSNFNHWLKSLDPLYGSTFRTGSYSIREQTVLERETHGWADDRNTPKGNGSSFAMKIYDLRIPIESEPPTGAPEFYNNFSFYSVAASASLFVQRKVKLTQRAIGMKPFRYRSKKPAYLPPITYTKV